MLISYKKVSICQDDKRILSDVDFNAEEGQFIYIIGKVGSGKSSLLKTMYCELDIDEAEEAEILGNDLMKIKRKHIPALRRNLGIIFQDFQLLHDRTIYKNLLFVLQATGWKDKQDINKRIDQVLESVGMPDVKEKMPHQLSGGEQQRIAIARALLNDPQIIIADEPTGNLDQETAENIISLLKKISSDGTTIIMSTHNISLLDKYPGIVYSCEDGKLVRVSGEEASNSVKQPSAQEESRQESLIDEPSTKDGQPADDVQEKQISTDVEEDEE